MGIVFAATLGFCGVHRFILGQWQWGLVHIFFMVISLSNPWWTDMFGDTPWTSLSAFIGYATAVWWIRMSDDEFAERYLEPVEEQVEGKYLKGKTTVHPKVKSRRARRKILASAKTRYDAYDYQQAADLYEDALDLDLSDGDSRVLAARCYSLLENGEDAYRHLRKAVQLKASNLDMLSSDEGFAWLRMQADFRARQRVGFAPLAPGTPLHSEPAPLPSPEPNLLDRLEQLGRLRERGLLDDAEFAREKRRLLQ